MEDLKISCQVEEVPFLSELVRTRLMAHMAQFTGFSPLFADGYLTRYDEGAQTVNNIISPLQLTGEMKKITKALAVKYREARHILNRLEFLINSAGDGLTVAPEDFGIKNIRDQISRKNDEGIAKGLHDLLNLIGNNSAALEATGLTPEYTQEVQQFVTGFTEASLGQTGKLEERMKHVNENAGTINAHWKMITEICKAGKIIGKAEGDEDMVKEFTMKELKKRVRVERKKQEETEE